MKTIARVGVWSCCWVAGLTVSVQGAEFFLKPIRASGSFTIEGRAASANDQPFANLGSVSGGFFSAMGIPITAGWTFEIGRAHV